MPAEKQYINFQPDSQPGFLQGEKSRAFGSGVGYFKDWFIELALVGIRSRFLSACPSDALAYHGSERSLIRYAEDTDLEYRIRLNNAWNLWTSAGTAYGITQQFGFAGFNHVSVIENWDLLDKPPGSDPITGEPYGVGDEWWRFYVIIDDRIDHKFGVSFHYGDGTKWGDKSWGFLANPQNIAMVHEIINSWKPAHTICAEVSVVLEGWIWGYGGDRWGTSGLSWGGLTVRI